MKIILILLAAVLHTTASQRCSGLDLDEREIFYSDYGVIHCSYNITATLTCSYTRNGKYIYESSTKLCSGDRIRVHFHSDEIGVLPGSAFEADFKITELYLDNLGISKISPGAFNHQYTIQSISMKKNKIPIISDGMFTSLTHLEKLDLSENQITAINEEAFSSVPLKELNLSKNAVSSIPSSLKDVKILDISYNSIKSLPSKAFSTVILNVSYNEIQRIDLTDFHYIKKLYVANNAVEQIYFPDSVEELEVLDVGANRISSLPNKTINGDHLKELYLNDNDISNIPVAFLQKLKKLEVLDLSKNGLSTFNFGTFNGLQSLKTLNISYNKFKDLPLHIFHSLRDLRNLYFSHNKLSDINVENLLKYVPKLEVADIRGYALSCYRLLEIVHKLGKHNVSVVHGDNTASNNIYGMNCTEVDNSVSVKEKSNSPEINEAYAILLNYFNKEFRNSNFVQYLENLKNVANRNENLILTRNFTDILADNKRFMRELIKTGNAQTDVLEKIMNMINETKTTDEMVYKGTDNNHANIGENIVNSLKQIFNYTEIAEQRRDEEIEEFFKMLTEKLQHEYKLPILHQVPDNDVRETLSSETPESQQQKMSIPAQLRSSADSETPGGYPPVLTFIAVLLTIITVSLIIFGYALFIRAKCAVHPNSDLELARLVESKPNTVNE